MIIFNWKKIGIFFDYICLVFEFIGVMLYELWFDLYLNLIDVLLS